MTGEPLVSPSAVEIRLLTYNVRGLRAGSAAVAAVIASVRPDVVCVQEAPVWWRWRTRAAELARLSGLYVVTGGRPAAGNVLLCAARVDRMTAEDHRFSRTPGLATRGCAWAILRVGGVKVGVIGVHFGLRASERSRHAEDVASIAERLRAVGAMTVVVAADLNSKPWSREWEPLLRRLRDPVATDVAWGTFPAEAPTARIDVVLVEPNVTVVSCAVPDHPDVTRASDHRPVLAVLQLPLVPHTGR